MRILVIPDIHEAANVVDDVERAIARESPDVTVFLGDYFDQWHDGPRDAARTAQWLRDSLLQPNRVHLLGNHDLAYRFPAATVAYCSGFTAEKASAINAVLRPSDWTKLRFAWWHDRIVFSHAGWSAHFVPPKVPDISVLRQHLEAEEVGALRCLQHDVMHWFYVAGRRRGGMASAGGIVWCDQREFKAIAGVNQIFGHTPCNRGVVVTGTNSVNICLDTADQVTGVNHYLVVDTYATPSTAAVHHIGGATNKVIKLG